MPKTLPATCVAGIVTADSLPVPGTTILSKGVASSAGLLVLDEDKTTYIANTSQDLADTIQHLIDVITDAASAITQIATSLTSIGAGMTGPTTAPPPTLAADVVQLGLYVTDLNAIKTLTTTLKANLK